MSEPAFQLFPGFKTPPNDPTLYVVPRREFGGDTGLMKGRPRHARLDDVYEEYCDANESGREISRRSGIKIANSDYYPAAALKDGEGFRMCPYCEGDGVSGWDEKERDVPCDHCEGGIIR